MKSCHPPGSKQMGSRVKDSSVEMSESEVIPTHFQLKVPWWIVLRSILLGPILVPLRILLMLIFGLTGYIYALIGTSQWYRRGRTHNTEFELWFYATLFRCVFRACGMMVNVEGEMSKETRLLVIAPHSTFWDGFVCGWTNMACAVSAEKNRQIPVAGRYFEMGNLLFVTPGSGANYQNLVSNWLEETKGQERHLIVFPEGMCGNRKSLLPFKTGVFRPGVPVQPVLIRYTNRLDTVTWTVHQNVGPLPMLILTLCQPYFTVTFEFLSVYTPSSEERSDPEIYANNVSRLMGKELGISVSKLTAKQWEQKLHAKEEK